MMLDTSMLLWKWQILIVFYAYRHSHQHLCYLVFVEFRVYFFRFVKMGGGWVGSRGVESEHTVQKKV